MLFISQLNRHLCWLMLSEDARQASHIHVVEFRRPWWYGVVMNGDTALSLVPCPQLSPCLRPRPPKCQTLKVLLFRTKVICAQRDPLWPMRCDLGPKWSQFMTKVIPTFPQVIYAQSDPKWSPYCSNIPDKMLTWRPSGPQTVGLQARGARKPAMGPYKPASPRSREGPR